MKTYSILKQEECQGMTYYEIAGTKISDIAEIKNIATGSIFYDILSSFYYLAYYENGVLKWQPQP